MLECLFCWLVWCLGFPAGACWHGHGLQVVMSFSNSVQIRMRCLCPDLGGLLPYPPSSPYPTGSWTGAKGLERNLVLSSMPVLLLLEPIGPSLTLTSAPLAREHRGPPIPARHWLPCWWRCTGASDDPAAQGWELGPQLGARCLRSPSTCRPVRDTVYASFCREYLNTCSKRPRTRP
jgi:hypothetical protein